MPILSPLSFRSFDETKYPLGSLSIVVPSNSSLSAITSNTRLASLTVVVIGPITSVLLAMATTPLRETAP